MKRLKRPDYEEIARWVGVAMIFGMAAWLLWKW
jgi:hypothetical protein